MKRVISSILIVLTLITSAAPLIASAQTATSCSSVTNLTQYASCCNGSSSDTLACKNFALASGGAGTTAANSCTNVSSLAQYSACCSGTSTDTNACKTFAAAEQSNASSVAQFNPNVNLGIGGNTYGGVSISGVGGAIASCLNVGGFLTSEATKLLSSSSVTKKALSPSSFIAGGGGAPVATNDATANAALADQNKTTDCLDGIAYAVAKNALAQITNKTLNWVNTGLGGNPLYVQNVSSLLGSIQNQQSTLFLASVQSSDPIFGNALRSSITLSLTGRNDGLINTPLNTPQAQSYASFQADFSNGGWNALLNPSYNPVGAYFNAVDTLSDNITNQQQQATNQIQRNNGFLDMTQCVQYANNGAVGQTTVNAALHPYTTTNGASANLYCKEDYSSEATAAIATCSNGPASQATQCEEDADAKYDALARANCLTTNTTTTNTSTNNGAGLNSQPICTKSVTTTPGSVISSQVQTVTNSPVQQLTYANKINEVLGSFFDSFVNNLLSKGLRGSGTTPVSTVDLGFSPSGTDNFVSNDAGSADSALGYSASGNGDVNTGDFDISRPQQLRAILKTQKDFLNRTLDAQIALERIVPAIGALDYCIPGPNPDYQTGLSSNWQTFVGSIEQAPADPSTLDNLVGALPVVGGLLGALFGSNKAPDIWYANSVLSDKATSGNIAIKRTFFDTSTDLQTSSVLFDGLQRAYEAIIGAPDSPTPDEPQLAYYNTTQNTFRPSSINISTVGSAFEQASVGHVTPAYVDGFLQDAYTETDNIVSYNETATAIDQQYNQNISDTENAIEQMDDIRTQVDQIVSVAKARYIKANPTVNVQCLNQAYIIDASEPVPVARVEPNAADAEEDAMVLHSINAANNFYSQEAI